MPRLTEQQYRDYLVRMHGAKKVLHQSPSANTKTECEADLHDQIIGECKRLGWLWVHARMDRASHLTIGAPDFIILADNGRVLLVECKRRNGKSSPEQIAFHAWAAKLGHTVFVVRSIEEFHAIKKFGNGCVTPGLNAKGRVQSAE